MSVTRRDTLDARPAVDAITVEVIGNALSSIVEEMGETLVRAAYSTNVKERRDSSTCLFDARGLTLCQAMHIPMHLGSLMGVVEHVAVRHPLAEVREGDVFIGNDAYTGGGTHLPDIVMIEPIVIDGAVVGWATNIAHHADFVDRGHAHIYQEGLRIPPVRLYREGRLQQDVLDLILLNCQVPHERRNDLRAQMAANRQGIRRFQSLCRKHGTDLVLAAGQALLDYTERMTRAGIATIPRGVYEFEDRFDTDEIPDEKVFKVRVEVTGDEMSLRFDSPPQVRAGLNLVWTGLLATVYYAVKTLVGPEIPANAGLFRPVHVSASPGTMLNCVAPAAVNSRTQTCQRVVDLIHGALAPAIPERVIAACNGACVSSTFSGVNPRTGQFYVYLETIGGGSGARATKDGLDGVHVHVTNTSNLPVEALEAEYPLVVERYALVEDSGGPGRWRGGLGLWRQIRAEGHECHAFVHGSRRLSAPWGLFGGREGGSCRIVYSPGVAPPVRAQAFLEPGQSVAIITPGAGGYGDPHERDPALVRRDLADGIVSERVAREVYGETG
ncbi:MAG TPA: hydantoinase B/oxoprolinase family protein [Candidatus Methylomirabilis sp.]|nr:hydantoinase B/oxoprolinase family protein [Candidatus Methylomirabilis sp.]